jgi:hypothetical protein
MWALILVLGCGKGDTDAIDADGDGFPAAEDCDDADADVNPDGTEVCDGVDNDCADGIDDPGADDAHAIWVDADGDGYGDPARLAKSCNVLAGWVTNGDDCDDADPDVFPGAGC